MRCKVCGIDRDSTAFRTAGGRICRTCTLAIDAAKRRAHRPRHALDPTIATLTCKQCGQTKAATLFRKDASCTGGYRRQCRQCHLAYKRRWGERRCPDCGEAISAKAKRCITCRRRDAEAKRLATERALRAAWMAERRIAVDIAVANEAQSLVAIRALLKSRPRRLIDPDQPVTRRRARERAKEAVKAALLSGDLVKPDRCQSCGEQRPVEGHHPSYLHEHRLRVIWLCQRCHGRLHQTMKQRGETVTYPDNATSTC